MLSIMGYKTVRVRLSSEAVAFNRWDEIKNYAGTNRRDEGFFGERDEVHGPPKEWALEFINPI